MSKLERLKLKLQEARRKRKLGECNSESLISLKITWLEYKVEKEKKKQLEKELKEGEKETPNKEFLETVGKAIAKKQKRHYFNKR